MKAIVIMDGQYEDYWVERVLVSTSDFDINALEKEFDDYNKIIIEMVAAEWNARRKPGQRLQWPQWLYQEMADKMDVQTKFADFLIKKKGFEQLEFVMV